MSVMRDFPDLPPVWMLAHGLLAFAAARLVPVVTFDGAAMTWSGVAVALVGVALAIWASLHFARSRTTIEPRETPSSLIVSGPFRVNRNPIYTGMALVLLGWALWLGALSAVIAVLPFPFVIARRFISGEEETLRRTFGAEAEAYIAETRRW